MKIFFFLMLLKCLLIAKEVLLPEATVAVVNGIAISEDELSKEVGRLLPNTYYHSNIDSAKTKDLEEEALKSLIEDTLLYYYAISKNIRFSNEEIDLEMKRLEETLGSKNKLEDTLKKLGFSIASFRQTVKKKETVKKLYAQEIKYKLTEQDLKKYYEENKYKFKEPEKIKARLIYVRNDPSDPDGKVKAKKRILEAQEELNNGENFAFVAQVYSNDPTRVKGGDLGYLHKGRLDMDVEKVAFSMDANTTSGIIEKDIGYFIVKVEHKKKQNQLNFEAVKDALKADLKNKEEAKRKAALLKKLFSTAVIIK